ncbi:MAG: hypothetical protein Q9218_006095 [Villophora microphyllina]
MGDILDDPRIRYYPTTLQYGPNLYLTGASVADLVSRDQVAEKLVMNFHSIVHSCDLAVWVDKLKILDIECNLGNEDVLQNLLCVLLPNLKSISIIASGINAGRFKQMVQAIALANRDSTSSCYGKALTHLESFSYSCDDDNEEDCKSIDLLEMLAMLPSIRILRGTNFCGKKDIFAGGLSFALGTSNVTELELNYSSISAEALDCLLAGLAGLKRFTYSHNCYITERGSHYDAPGIIEALRNNAAHRLEFLRLKAWRQPDLLTFDEDQQYIGSLRMFQSLKSIQLQDLVFRIWENKDETSEDDDESAYKDEHRPYSWRNVPYRMDRLEKILPTSVETVHLMQELEDSDMANLLRGLSGKGKKRVPNLKSLVFEQKTPLTEDLQWSLRWAGIEISSLNHQF